jgi:hypothetical protein
MSGAYRTHRAPGLALARLRRLRTGPATAMRCDEKPGQGDA